MYCESSHKTKSIVFCSSLSIHILVLSVLFITYQVKNIVSSHVLNLLPVATVPRSASVIFQQPHMRDKQSTAPDVSNSSHDTLIQAEEIADTVDGSDREVTCISQPIMSQAPQEIVYIQQPPETLQRDIIPVKKRSSYTKVYKPNPQLNQLFKTFSHNIQEEKLQKATPAAQTYDLVMDNYKKKLALFFANAVCYKPNTVYGAEPIATIAEICITFNEKGLVTKFEFKHPLPKHKLQAVEDTIKKLIYSSGLFPPIPRTLKPHDTYTFSLLIDIQITEGIHKYSVIHK